MGQSPRGDAPELPFDIPPEYAEAYLRGFQRAYKQASEAVAVAAPPVPPQGTPMPLPAEPDSSREEPLDVGEPSWADVLLGFDEDDDSTVPGWLIPLLTGILLVVLFAAVYAMGR